MKKYIVPLCMILIVSMLTVFHGNIFQAIADIHTKSWVLESVYSLDGTALHCPCASIQFDQEGNFVLTDESDNKICGKYILEKLTTAYKLIFESDELQEIGVYCGKTYAKDRQEASIIFKMNDRVWRFVSNY